MPGSPTGSFSVSLLLPENWVHVLLSVEPKDTTRPKFRRRKDLLLAASKENTGDLSQSMYPQTAKLEKY